MYIMSKDALMPKEKFLHIDVTTGKDHSHKVTVCVLVSDEDDSYAFAAGVSICLEYDQYSKKLGNKIARGRAYKALDLKRSSNPIRKAWTKWIGYNFKCKYLVAGISTPHTESEAK